MLAISQKSTPCLVKTSKLLREIAFALFETMPDELPLVKWWPLLGIDLLKPKYGGSH